MKLKTILEKEPGLNDELEPNVWAIPRAIDWTETDHEASLRLQDEEAARIALGKSTWNRQHDPAS